MEELLDAVVSGPVGCVLEGMPGIGKTTLWREIVQGARMRGYRVLATVASEPDSVLAFSCLSDLLEEPAADALGALPGAQAIALKAALLLGELPEDDRGQQALPRAVLGILRQLSGAGPLVIAIDDEQWLDRASARVLAFALCRLRTEPIAVILARRPAPDGLLSTELRRRFDGGGLETITLGPLPMNAIKTLIEARLERTLPQPLLRRIHQGAGGNPLYALAIATELDTRRANGDRAGDLPIARTLAEAIELRLGHLEPRASAAMFVIAALSQPTLAMLQAAIPDFALSDLDGAEQAGVIEISGGRLRFTHPLLASTHYANTPASQRRELHRLLAMVVDDEEERAQHLALGAAAPDSDIADTLEKASRAAARRGATETAAQLLEDAASLTPLSQSQAWRERIVAAAEHRFSSGEVSRAREMLEELMPDLASGTLRARARLQLASIRADEPLVMVELYEAALEDAGEDDCWRAKVGADLAVACQLSGSLAAGREHAEAALRAAERLGDRNLIAKALGQLLLTRVATGEPMPQEVFARLSAMEECSGISTYYQPSTATGMAHYFAGDDDAARPLLERAALQALARGEEWDRLGMHLTLAELEWATGNQDASDRHREAAEEALGEYAEDFLWTVSLAAVSALERGDVSTVRAKVEHALSVAERNGALWQASRLTAILADVELLSGEPESAHSRLKELCDWLRSSGFGPAGARKSVIWGQDVEALIALDRLDDAQVVLAELRSRAELTDSPHLLALASRCEGMLLAARGELGPAIEAMDAALAAHARCQWPFERGRVLLEKGVIERRAKRKSAAKQTLEQALAILESLGAQIWVARTRDELSRIGLRKAKATEGLTPAQDRVAELVGAGLTNPQIARELHMSLRTVESHLSRVYREYGVSSRSQLASVLAVRAAS